MIYFQLFLAFLQIGAFSFGGGYAAMPLIQAQVIEKYHWLTLNDFTNLITIAEMTPGPIAVNSSTFVGNQVAGLPGAIVATIGCILPSCIFVTILAKLLTAGITILVPTFFGDGTIHLTNGNLQIRYLIYFAVAMVCLRKVKIDPIKVMVSCGFAEVLYQLVLSWLPIKKYRSLFPIRYISISSRDDKIKSIKRQKPERFSIFGNSLWFSFENFFLNLFFFESIIFLFIESITF